MGKLGTQLPPCNSAERLLREYPEQTTTLDSHDPTYFRVSSVHGFELRKIRPREGFLLLKNFLSRRVVIGPNSLSQSDLFLAALVLDYLREVKDPLFQLSFRRWLVETTIFLRKRNIWSCFTETLEESAVEEARRKGSLVSSHAYFGWVRFFRIETYLRRINRNLNPRPRPKRFVGVGYQDHGTARNLSVDANPSWQEVAGARITSPDNPRLKSIRDTVLWLKEEEELLNSSGLTLTSAMIC